MSGIVAIIQETEDTLLKAKQLLQNPAPTVASRTHRRKPPETEESSLTVDETTETTRTAETITSAIASTHSNTNRQAAKASKRRKATGNSGHDSAQPGTDSGSRPGSHYLLDEHYVSGFPRILPNPGAVTHVATAASSLDDSDVLRRKLRKLEHVTQQQDLELKHAHKTMSAMQTQLDVQQRAISDLQSELLPLLSRKQQPQESADSIAIADIQENVNRLQKDVYQHVTRRRKEDDLRKQQLDSLRQQCQWMQDTSKHDGSQLRKELEQLHLALDGHATRLTSCTNDAQTTSSQVTIIQRALQNNEQHLEVSREELLGQVHSIRMGLNELLTRLLYSTTAEQASHAAGRQPQTVMRQQRGSAAEPPLDRAPQPVGAVKPTWMQHGYKQHSGAASSRPGPAVATLLKSSDYRVLHTVHTGSAHKAAVAVPSRSRSQTRHGKLEERDAEEQLLRQDITDISQLSNSGLEESLLSGRHGHHTPINRDSANGGQSSGLDSDFERLRNEDDQLLAELERYTLPEYALDTGGGGGGVNP